MLIAKRDLQYTPAAGTLTNVPISLFAPEHTGQDWRCRYTIGWPDEPQEGAGYGVDAMQALILTLQMIGARIYCSDYHETGKLYFETPGSGYGFPVPKNIRDILIGDDARFEG
ncbi:DUF6968 family protein [Microvirga puerhi]|uniref:DUF6968 domain-containing protein n=1 Tax=Microvirga puerhi TaxID=2876078 RepID=A0ABS7VVN1_9HYPH|nr:hypothetical protein [Microvirga puerhi]MBZ6079239.1 hypothetical protein [Microvirga puerhi]